jgi:hypothetical protein
VSTKVDEARSQRLRAAGIYLAAIAIGNLAWEVLQLPLYTLWTAGTFREQAFAVLHCTGGDLLIAGTALLLVLVLVRARDWPARGFWKVALLAIVLGVVYTGFSEWLNVSVRRTWTYSAWMPVIPIGSARIGLSPLLQWVVIPAAAFWVMERWCSKLRRSLR